MDDVVEIVAAGRLEIGALGVGNGQQAHLRHVVGDSQQLGRLGLLHLLGAGRILGGLPPLEIARDGETLRVRARAGIEELRPWLRRALDALASRS